MEIECTQRLECTQDLYNTQTERTDPEQIGFLGICGTKYPVKRGPNKIGRDPQTCRIHLNLNSISRQHAVINVLSMSEFMLMDLDSANKTKVQGTTLQPYIPHPLKNGDMVQLGDIFGVFRLLEDDTDLPMTQALDLPCTPAPASKQMSRIGAPSVLVPESPEVSDMDDSFIMPSQPKKSTEFKSPMNKFIKPSNKTVAIQPMGSKTIDNAYWASAKKSDSFNFQLDDSGSTLNDSAISNKSNKVIDESNDNIHEMETQVPYKANDSTDSIYTANTQQIPPPPSIHCMETQQPTSDIYVQETQQVTDIHALDTQNVPDTIHDCETQAPVANNLPKVCKLEKQEELQIDLLSANKENVNSIFNAETQAFPTENEVFPVVLKMPEQKNTSIHETSKEKNDSDEEIVFDELNTQSFHDDCESQPLIPAGNVSPQIERIENMEVSLKRTRKESGSSTDCEDSDILPKNAEDIGMLPTQKLTSDIDMLPTQKLATDINVSKTLKLTNDIDILPTQKIVDNDIEMLPTQKLENNDDEDLTDCEDEIVNHEVKDLKDSPEIDFEDMATQIIGNDEIDAVINKTNNQIDGSSKGTSFEELPTQLITDDSKDDNFEDLPTQIIEINEEKVKEVTEEVYSEEMISPFKVPFPTPLKNKKTAKMDQVKPPTPIDIIIKDEDEDNPNYYAATQDIFNDLCTQREPSPETRKMPSNESGIRSRNVRHELADKGDNESDQNMKKTGKLIKNQKSGSLGASAVLKTPKTLKIMNADLPDSQEIKTSVTLKDKSVTESSSDSETDDVSDQERGIIVGRKRKPRINAKQDLSKKFEESLPTRIITRVRKPTLKLRDSDESSKNQCKSILKNTVMVDSDDNIDAEIINENISRLKSKTDKKKEKGSRHEKRHPNKPNPNDENRKTGESTEEPVKDNVRKSTRSRSKKTEESKPKTDEHDDSKDKKVTRSTRHKKEISKDDKSKTGREKRESKEKDSNHSNSRSDSKSRSDSNSRSKTRSSSKENKKDTKSEEKSKLDKTESSPETEVRRSSRQKTKDSKEVTAKHENSTVYLSSESSTESPKNLKRSALNVLEEPSPKRTRSLPNPKSSSAGTSVSANTASASTSVCSTPVRVDTHYVLFTAFSNDDVRGILEKLGAVLVTDVMACTVLVTLQVKRTFKLLCAVGLGRPVVGPDWVQACVDTNTIVDPWLYIIKDVPAEKRFKFSLEKTLRGNRNFLKGFNVSSTPSVLPNAQEMKLIVECSGGAWKAEGPNWICVSCSADKALWGALRRRGAVLVSTEFILGGVLRQRPDVEATAFGVPVTKKKDGAGEFVCTECGRRCLSRIGLSSHVRSHTKSCG